MLPTSPLFEGFVEITTRPKMVRFEGLNGIIIARHNETNKFTVITSKNIGMVLRKHSSTNTCSYRMENYVKQFGGTVTYFARSYNAMLIVKERADELKRFFTAQSSFIGVVLKRNIKESKGYSVYLLKDEVNRAVFIRYTRRKSATQSYYIKGIDTIVKKWDTVAEDDPGKQWFRKWEKGDIKLQLEMVEQDIMSTEDVRFALKAAAHDCRSKGYLVLNNSARYNWACDRREVTRKKKRGKK